MSDIAVKLENVSKFYKLYNESKDRLKEALHPLGKKYHRKFYALNNINLEIRKGEILGIVGRNGAGKSTLLKLISGVIQPSSGKIQVNGNISALLDLGVGFNPEFTGIQNIYFSGTMMGFSRQEMKEKINDIINFADIGDYIHQPLKSYSSGMKARLGFSLAINMEPQILVLDEVLSVGDELFRRKCYAKMEEFFNSGCTVLYVSHTSSSINEICSRVIMIDKGEVILEGVPKFVNMYYQKYLFTEPDRVKEVRDEIIRLNKDEEQKKKFAADIMENQTEKDKSETPGKEERGNKKAETGSEQKSFFIPNFVPKSTIVHKDYGVEISDVNIETPEKRRVNALVMNDVYILSYKVKFQLTLDNVKFLALIRSEKGLSISGIMIPRENSDNTPVAKKGETYLIRSKFRCTLLPGIYYISVSVTTVNNESQKFPLCRISDAAVFKVQREKDLKYWGIVNLGQSGEVQQLT